MQAWEPEFDAQNPHFIKPVVVTWISNPSTGKAESGGSRRLLTGECEHQVQWTSLSQKIMWRTIHWLLASGLYTEAHTCICTPYHTHKHTHKEQRKEEFHKVTTRDHKFTNSFSINNMAEGLACTSSSSTCNDLGMGHCFSCMLLWKWTQKDSALAGSHTTG